MAKGSQTSTPEPPIDPVTKIPRAFSPEAQALPWPESVPILLAGDLGNPREPKDPKRPTIWCWFLLTFPTAKVGGVKEQMADVVHNELFRVQTEVFGRKQALSLKYFALEYSPETVAALWNHVMARLGYTVPKERLSYGKDVVGRGTAEVDGS